MAGGRWQVAGGTPQVAGGRRQVAESEKTSVELFVSLLIALSSSRSSSLSVWLFVSSHVSCHLPPATCHLAYSEYASFAASNNNSSAKTFFSLATGMRCAMRAPTGARKTLVSEMPTSAGM